MKDVLAKQVNNVIITAYFMNQKKVKLSFALSQIIHAKKIQKTMPFHFWFNNLNNVLAPAQI